MKMSDYLSRRVQARDNIEILYHNDIRKMSGGKKLEPIELENTTTGARRVVMSVPPVTSESSNSSRSVVPARPVKVISYVCAGTTATPFASAGS
jgi:hypothetical protein